MGAENNILPFSLLLLQIVKSTWLCPFSIKIQWPGPKKQCFENPSLECQPGCRMLRASWGWQDTLDVESTHLFFSFG